MSNLINDISTFISTHESTMVVLSAWVSKEWHVAWPAIKNSFPYVRDNGGLWGLFVEFIVGKKNATDTLTEVPKPVTQIPVATVTPNPTISVSVQQPKTK